MKVEVAVSSASFPAASRLVSTSSNAYAQLTTRIKLRIILTLRRSRSMRSREEPRDGSNDGSDQRNEAKRQAILLRDSIRLSTHDLVVPLATGYMQMNDDNDAEPDKSQEPEYHEPYDAHRDPLHG